MALGDWTADDTGRGLCGGALVFGVALAVIASLRFWTHISSVPLFWATFILTRPLGATVDDFLDKPHDHGGLALDRTHASLVLQIAIVALLLIFPQRAGRHQSAAIEKSVGWA